MSNLDRLYDAGLTEPVVITRNDVAFWVRYVANPNHITAAGIRAVEDYAEYNEGVRNNQAARMKTALEWIRDNPWANSTNIQNIVEEALK